MLTSNELERKGDIACTIYRHETSRFLGVLPVSPFEGLRRISSHDCNLLLRWIETRQPIEAPLDDPGWAPIASTDPIAYQASFHAFLAGYGMASSPMPVAPTRE